MTILFKLVTLNYYLLDLILLIITDLLQLEILVLQFLIHFSIMLDIYDRLQQLIIKLLLFSHILFFLNGVNTLLADLTQHIIFDFIFINPFVSFFFYTFSVTRYSALQFVYFVNTMTMFNLQILIFLILLVHDHHVLLFLMV